MVAISLQYQSEAARREFRTISEDGFEVLQNRLQTYLQSIRGTAAFVAASEQVTQSDFENYVGALDIERQLPSLTGLGLIVEVPTEEIETFTRQMRLTSNPDFTVRRLSDRDMHFIIKYMLPERANAAAIGLDATFADERAQVLAAARDTGEPRMTPPIDLVQTEGAAKGSVLFMPIYAPPRTEADRGAFLGWINAAFVADDLFSGLTSTQGSYYTAKVLDRSAPGAGEVFFSQQRDWDSAYANIFRLDQFNRAWEIRFESTQAFEVTTRSYQPLLIFLAGLSLTGMVAQILRSIRLRNENLQQISDMRTRQLAAREQEVKSVVENEVTSVLLVDKSDRVLFANHAAQKCFGFAPEEMHGVKISVFARAAQSADGSYNAVGKTRTGEALELDLQRNDWTDGNGDRRSTVVIRDVTMQNRAQQELSHTKAVYDMALEGGEIGVFDIDLLTGKSEVSQTWCRIMGYDSRCHSLETQKLFLERVHPDDLPALERADADCIAGRTKRSIAEYRLRTPDGNWCWMRSDATVVARDSQGRALRLIGTQTDVTDLRHSKNALETNEQMFRQMLTNAPIGMALIDDEGKFVVINGAFAALRGSTAEQMEDTGQFNDLIPPEDRETLRKAVFDSMKENYASVYTAEHRIVCAQGEIRWGLLNISWFFDKNKNRDFFIAQVVDITEQKKLEFMKDEFVSTVSHELRTPLTSIKGALGLLAGFDDGNFSSGQKRLVQIAKSNADRLADIVNDILDLEKISAGEVAFDIGPVDLTEVVRTAACDMALFAKTHASTIRLDLPTGPVSVFADHGRTQQVLANLISNACKYSDADSEIVIKAECIADMAIVYVQNVGEGIPDSFRSRIFKPFSQADASDTRTTGGTGLGLNISRQIVVRQGGKIGFESLRGSVTVFWFTIPLHAADADQGATELALLPAPPGCKTNILHVEDDADFAEVLSRAMSDFADIQHATCLATARKVIAQENLDVVILDWSLPDGDADDLLDQITERHPQARIIGLSANNRQSDDPRLYANIVKSQTELDAVVASIHKCMPLAS